MTPEAVCGIGKSSLPFEAHITIEPVEGKKLEDLELLAKAFGFKVANLYMIKDRKVTEERSNRDTFCTGWSDDVYSLIMRTKHLIAELRLDGFLVWRYKVEATLVDERF